MARLGLLLLLTVGWASSDMSSLMAMIPADYASAYAMGQTIQKNEYFTSRWILIYVSPSLAQNVCQATVRLWSRMFAIPRPIWHASWDGLRALPAAKLLTRKPWPWEWTPWRSLARPSTPKLPLLGRLWMSHSASALRMPRHGPTMWVYMFLGVYDWNTIYEPWHTSIEANKIVHQCC